VEVIDSPCIDVVKDAREISVRETASEVVPRQPTPEEISRLTFAKLRDVRVHAQVLRNRFARLLNRGSSLE
jgi:hypothetical protein